MSKVLVPLAQGCEELEAITITDLLVRAGIEVTTASLDDEIVTASRGTRIIADTNINDVRNNSYDLIVLPGGLPGADHLRDNEIVQSLLKKQARENKFIAAICAAPKALAQAGLLDNRSATGYPGVLSSLKLPNTAIKDSAIEIDGNIITSRGPGTAMDFALTLIEILEGKDKRNEVNAQLVR
jgi:protein deglycase